MLTDIEIARSAKMRKIVSIANELDIQKNIIIFMEIYCKGISSIFK